MADLLLSAMYRITDFPGESEPPAVTEPVEPLVGEDASVEDLLNSVVWPTQDTYAYNPNQARAPKGSSVGGQWIPTPSGLLEKVTSSTPLTGGYVEMMGAGARTPGDDPHGGLSSVVNPDRKKFGGMTNCVNVVVTAEMRLRGNDVKAKVDAGYSMSSDITRVFRTSLGFEPQFSRPANYKDARQAMALGKPGTRYIVGGFRQDYSSGHVWSAEVDEYGTLREFDWQSGDMDPGFLEGDHFWRVQYLRVDNLVLNEDAVMNGYDFSMAYPGRGRGVPMAVPYDQEQGDDDGTAYERDTLTASSEPVTLPPEVEVVEEILRPDGSVLLITEPALWDDCTYFKDPLTGQVVRVTPERISPDFADRLTMKADEVEWSSAPLTAAGNPDQARAPRGTPIGGQWIKVVGALLKEARRADSTEKEDANWDVSGDYVVPQHTQPVAGFGGRNRRGERESDPYRGDYVGAVRQNSQNVSEETAALMKEYTAASGQINWGLRSGSMDEERRAQILRAVEEFTPIAGPTRFYRGVRGIDLKPGDRYMDRGFTSLTPSFDYASDVAASSGDMILDITVPAGMPMFDPDFYNWRGSESENLLPPGMAFQVMSVEPYGNYRMAKVEVLIPAEMATASSTDEAIAASGFNPAQARIPKGQSGGGRWIDTPSGLLTKVARFSKMPGWDRDPASERDYYEDLADYLETRYVFGAEGIAEVEANEDAILLSRTYGRSEFSVEVEVRTPGTRGAADVDGRILDRNGNDIGTFNRTFYWNSERDQLEVNHNHLEVDEAHQGTGFGTEFSQESEQMYADMGVKRINVLAGLSDGGLAWARAGYVLDEDDTYINFDYSKTGKFQSIVDRYKNSDTDDLETIEFLDRLSYARGEGGLKYKMGQVNLAEAGITIEDLLYFTDAQGNPVGEELLRGSLWTGYKDITPSPEALEQEVEALAASGTPGSWFTSAMRAEALWKFCYENRVEYTADLWPLDVAEEWRAIDREGRLAWENSNLLAAGFSPEQVRAPKGTPIGGRWIDTPSGLLMELTAGGPKRVWIDPKVDMESAAQKDLHAIKPEYAASLIAATRGALRTARNDGVHVSINGPALLNVLADGRMKNVQELEKQGGEAFEDAMGKVLPRMREEHLDSRRETLDAMGIPAGTPVEDLPIFGWGNRSGVDETYLFGAYTVRLKPEVLDRTSFTIGDSFLDSVPPIMANDIETASDETILQASQWNARNALSGYMSGAEDLSWSVPYVEAQVHGGVSLADIDAILINPEVPTTLRDTIITTARGLGLPVVEGWGPTRYTAHADSTTESTYDGWDLAAVTASGFNPDQARAPRGTSIGGRWITTPSGLLRYLRDGEAEEGLSGHTAGISLNRIDPRLEVYREAWESLPTDEDEMGNTAKDEVAFITQEYLREAIREGVHISVTEHTLKGVAEDGRFHTMRDRLNVNEVKHGGDEESMWEDPTSYTRGVGYVTARELYENSVMGVPQNLADDQRPIYGWATRESPWETSGYGDIDITLKESVNDRTTWTIGDSLNLQSRPLWTDEILSDETDRDSLLAASHWAIGPSYGPDGSMAARPGWEQGPEMFETSYVEAQVFGGITLDDIESVEISSRNDYPELEDAFATLEAHGITIETWDNS